MLYSVKVLHLDGKSRSLLIEADSVDELYKINGLADSIQSVSNIPFIGNLLTANTKLKLVEELLIVAQIATLVDSGADIQKGIKEIIEATPKLRRLIHDPRINYASRVSHYLELFGASDSTILLAKSGEASGNLNQALATAVENIEHEIELEKAIGAELYLGIGYMFAGTLIILVLSLALGNAAQNIIDNPRLKDNAATHFLVMMNHIELHHTVLFLGAAALIVWSVLYLWNNSTVFKMLPGISALDALLKARRSAGFLSSWTPLYESGMDQKSALEMILKNVSGKNKIAFQSILDQVEEGKSIPKSLATEHWSPSLIIGMNSFDSAHDEARLKLLRTLKKLVLTEIFSSGKTFSKIAMRVGTIAAVANVMTVAFGFYIPILLAGSR